MAQEPGSQTVNRRRTKSVEQSIADTDDPDTRLRKDLNWWDLTVFGVSVVIGAGIFTITASTAANLTGPAISVSFIFAAIACGTGRAVLRRVRLDRAGRGQRVHLLLRDVRRVRRLDHRLGPDPGVRRRGGRRGQRLVQLPRHRLQLRRWRHGSGGLRTGLGRAGDHRARHPDPGDGHQTVGRYQPGRSPRSRSRWCCWSSSSARSTSRPRTSRRSCRRPRAARADRAPSSRCSRC